MNSTSDPLSEAPLSAITGVLELLRYASVTSPVLLVYDFSLTLDDEVCLIFSFRAYFARLTAYSQIRLVWPGPLSLPKVMFYINRYLAMITAIYSNYR